MSGKTKAVVRFMLAISAVLLLMTAVKVDARAEGKVSKSTKTSITIAWDDPEYYDQEITVHNYYVGIGRTMFDAQEQTHRQQKKLKPSSRSATFKGLKSNTQYYIEITYSYETIYNPGKLEYTNRVLYSDWVYTTPDDATGLKGQWKGARTVRFNWNRGQKDNVKFQFKLMDGKGKTVDSDDGLGTYVEYYVDRFKVYSGKVRAYNMCEGKPNYSKWTKPVYLIQQPSAKQNKTVLDVSVSKKGVMTVKWHKMTGVSGYNVYMSTKNGNYKKVKSVAANKNSCTISKFNNKKIKKSGRYFVYVEAYKKVGGKIYKSPSNVVTQYH